MQICFKVPQSIIDRYLDLVATHLGRLQAADGEAVPCPQPNGIHSVRPAGHYSMATLHKALDLAG